MVIKEKTEEVCDECGSTNIGYDALVRNIGGKLEIVGGPYDSCQCINEYCQNLETHVRNVPVQDLRYCDGKDCHYLGDKEMMTSKMKLSSSPSFLGDTRLVGRYKHWYCSVCMEKI